MVRPVGSDPKRLSLAARVFIIFLMALVVGLAFAVGLVWLIGPDQPV